MFSSLSLAFQKCFDYELLRSELSPIRSARVRRGVCSGRMHKATRTSQIIIIITANSALLQQNTRQRTPPFLERQETLALLFCGLKIYFWPLHLAFLNLQHTAPGSTRVKGEWEMWNWLFVGGTALAILFVSTRPNTNPHDWARDEAAERLRRKEVGVAHIGNCPSVCTLVSPRAHSLTAGR